MIVTLAGHVDHGKTALVHALTGVDTDRLEEEKKRGLTIELGFAYGEFEGTRVGFVDVPGHHRFIRNMIAGVSSEQFALFVIAADEGPHASNRGAPRYSRNDGAWQRNHSDDARRSCR